MKDPKVGERVRRYRVGDSYMDGTITEVGIAGVCVKFDNGCVSDFHRTHLVRLKPKPKTKRYVAESVVWQQSSTFGPVYPFGVLPDMSWKDLVGKTGKLIFIEKKGKKS